MKLLTFLGTGKYETTTYHWQGQEHTCAFAPVASCVFLNPDSITVFLTEEAEQQVFPGFKTSLPAGLPVHPVPVPLGQDEGELWQVFDQVSGTVKPGEAVAFDITHGLRSFPLVGLLAAAFLQAGLKVDLRAVLYGAFDARDRSTTPSRTPMFDLSAMLSLLEWAAAADRFNRTGDARYLASLLKGQRKRLAQAAAGEAALLQEVGRLGNLAGALTSISQALQLIRPNQAAREIAGLSERLEKAQAALQRSMATRPFSLLLESIQQTYQPLGMADPELPEAASQALVVQRAMIHWYAERERWVQAVSLAREWLLSWVMIQLGENQLNVLATRQQFESVLGAEANSFVMMSKPPIFLQRLPQAETVLKLWPQLTQVRNDIDHAGMREQPGQPESLVEQIQQCIQTLDQLPP